MSEILNFGLIFSLVRCSLELTNKSELITNPFFILFKKHFYLLPNETDLFIASYTKEIHPATHLDFIIYNTKVPF